MFGQAVADYLGSSGSTLERENIYRGGRLLATDEHLNAAVPSALATTPSSSNVALSWTAASGASKYRVERKGAGAPYALLTTTTTNSFTDSGASGGSAYLYRVCAADNNGNCTSDYSNIALGASLNFPTDSTITGYSESPSSATTIKAAHITELRTATDAVRTLAGLSAASYTHTTLTAQSSLIYADDVRELRTRLNDALVAMNIQTSSYTDNTIISFADDPLNVTVMKAVHIRELRTRTTSGAGNSSSGGTSGGLHYVLSDLQGTTRAVINNNGSSSAIVARHDYLPFGEEIGANVGLRSSSQGYNATDTNRWKYGMTERDAASGLDHTLWRKYDSFPGRWTSPDPYNGSMAIANPQSFNHYSYVQNDPVNFIDPSGLCTFNITINGVTNRAQLRAMQNEISRIFGAANQTVIFNQATAAGINSNTSFTINVQQAGNPGHPDAPGWTPVTIDSYGTASVAGSGFASTGVLAASIQNSSDSALRRLGMADGNFGRALGRVAAHEAGHHFLQLIGHSSEGLMQQYGADWWRTGSSYEARFRFTAAQAQQLSKLCPQAPSHPTTAHELLHGIGGGGGGIGPAFFGGGGYPSWWSSMQGFLDFVNSIPVGGGYVTVSACVGSDCSASTLGHELLHSR